MSRHVSRGGAPPVVSERGSTDSTAINGGALSRLGRACGTPADASHESRFLSRARHLKGKKTCSSAVGFGTSPVTPTGGRCGRQSSAACGGTRRYRQYVNELYLRMSAAHYGSVGGLSSEALESPLETLDWGIERPQNVAVWLREFWLEMRDRLPHSPPLERVLRGSGDAWSVWEPFRECTEEEEATMLAALSGLASGSSRRQRATAAMRPVTLAAKSGSMSPMDELCSQLDHLPLEKHVDGVDEDDAVVHRACENMKERSLGAKHVGRVASQQDGRVFSFDEEFSNASSVSTPSANDADQNTISETTLSFFRLDYATRTLFRRHARELWRLIALHESLWREHGLLPHLDVNQLIALPFQEQTNASTCPDAMARSRERAQLAAWIRNISRPESDSVYLTLSVPSRFHRRIIQGIAAYHKLNWDVISEGGSVAMEGVRLETMKEEVRSPCLIRLAGGQRTTSTVAVPLACLVYHFPSCDGNVHQAVRCCQQW